MLQKKMYKVICPIEKKDGSKFWMRLGSGFTNKDDSINIYLDAIPVGKEFHLQLRELTEDDLRERSDRRASYSARGTLGTAHAGGAMSAGAGASSQLGITISDTTGDVPF